MAAETRDKMLVEHAVAAEPRDKMLVEHHYEK